MEDVPIRVAAAEIAEVEAVSVVQTVAIAATTLPAVDIIVHQTAVTTIGTVEVPITATVAGRVEVAIDLDSNTGHHPIDFRAKVMIDLTIGYVSHPFYIYVFANSIYSFLQNDSRNRGDSPSRKRARNDVSQFAYSICIFKKKLINLEWISIFVWSLIYNYYQKYCKQLNSQHDIFSSQNQRKTTYNNHQIDRQVNWVLRFKKNSMHSQWLLRDMRSIWIVRMKANKTNEDLLRLNGIFSHPFEQNRPNKRKK